MNSYLIISFISDDKPGLVENLANIIADNKGNWLESNMSQLAGKFTGILRVNVAAEDAEQLIAALEKQSGNFKLLIESVDGNPSADIQQSIELSLVGNDRPGIVSEITQIMTAKNVNVENLSTECQPAPISGDSLFKANMLLNIPQELTLEALQTELENLADDLVVEIRPTMTNN